MFLTAGSLYGSRSAGSWTTDSLTGSSRVSVDEKISRHGGGGSAASFVILRLFRDFPIF